MSDVGVVAIGRNEGERLRRCLASVTGRGMPVVYVDSDSSDGSAELARSTGAEVVALDLSRPFSAARARNEGFERLLSVAPDVRFVQFVDGDCEIVAGWIERAVRELEARADVAVVCGRRRERHPERSIYNRLADMEWDTPVGEAKSCGGDAMMRVGAFREVGGFDGSVAAGEEPELCQRIREKGHKVLRVDAEMTLHDADILRFGQWWKRAVRGGYGAMDVATRFGGRGLFVSQVTSARRWAIGWPVAVVLALVVPMVMLPRVGVPAGQAVVWGVVCSAVVAMALPMQVMRLALRRRGSGSDWGGAIAYGGLTMVGKCPAMVGVYQYRRDRAAGRNTRLIEYKNPCATPITKPT